MELVVGALPSPTAARAEVEVVERKGVGHPDTICDAVAEAASAALSAHYRAELGAVLHHNVDKVLLVGGASEPRFGGGRVAEPIDLHLAGRAVRKAHGRSIPVDDLVTEAARSWIERHLRDVDANRQVRFHCHIRPGSADLVTLFERRDAGAPSCNDTSIGVGFAPATRLERAVRSVDELLRSPSVRRDHPQVGEDLKIMAVRRGERARLTVANAFVDAHLPHLTAYRERKAALGELVRERLGDSFGTLEVEVNAADDLESGDVYLTVTGTSAEAGDDGEAGRGNRANGLITPMRPMTMESVAGKNPVSHVGKIYNVVANRIAHAVCERVPEAHEATCSMVSRIGSPVDEPQIVDVRVGTDGSEPSLLRDPVAEVVESELARTSELDPAEVLSHLTWAEP